MANHSAAVSDKHGTSAPIAGAHDSHDVSKAVRTYLIIGGSLIVGTFLTVWASYIDFGTPTINDWTPAWPGTERAARG